MSLFFSGSPSQGQTEGIFPGKRGVF